MKQTLKQTLIPLSAAAFMLLGCNQQPVVQQQPVQPKPKKAKSYSDVPKPPKKKIELKDVEDENFSADYMYPDANKKPEKSEKIVEAAPAAVTEMTKAECVSMLGQEKFDKYAEMFNGDAGAIKKCKMLKAL